MKFSETLKAIYKAIVTYFIVLIELLVCGAIASPIATILVFGGFLFFDNPGDINGGIYFSTFLAFFSIYWGPMLALPFFIVLVCPFVMVLKYKRIDNFWYWLIGFSLLGAIFTFIFSVIEKVAHWLDVEKLYYQYVPKNYDEYSFFMSVLFVVASAFVSALMFGIYKFERSISR